MEDEEHPAKLLKLSDLIQNARTLTATTSYLNTSTSSSSSSIADYKNPNPKPSSSTDLTPLTPLLYPAFLAGILTLPAADGDNCFQFYDGSATVCCDIIGFDVRVISKQIRVVSWNFIPLGRHRTGFLEIIKWEFVDLSGSNVNSLPLVTNLSSTSESQLIGSHRVYGAVEFISPVSVFPSSTSRSNPESSKGSRIGSSGAKDFRGFIVQIMVCECGLCCLKESAPGLENLRLVQGVNSNHNFAKPVFIFFRGSALVWHPAFTKLVGSIVALSGLKKKMVYIEKEESHLMLITVDNAALHLPISPRGVPPQIKTNTNQKVEFSSYTGVVKGIYMQGMVVELEKDVWLLLTDQLIILPHSLRPGALISVRNVHFVNPKFSWTKMLILGACYKTSIIVDSFSPLETGALVIISCFRRKFAGLLSDKEILGSKHKEGLAQTYACSCLPSSSFYTRHGVFTELCKQSKCGCKSEHGPDNLNLIVPISKFIRHCEAAWIRMVSRLKNASQLLVDNNKSSDLVCDGKSYGQSLRGIFSNKDLGIILLGYLKISPSSGRLQLVDATGGIDIFIPDLPIAWNGSNLFEVKEYNVVIDGRHEVMENQGLYEDEIFSCRNIFQTAPIPRQLNLLISVNCCMRNATQRNLPSPFCMDHNSDKILESGTYHLLRVTHKFPMLQKFQDGVVLSDKSSMFVEAILLPWNLFLGGRNVPRSLDKVSRDLQKEPMERCTTKNYQESIPRKRQKIDLRSCKEVCSDSLDLVSCGSRQSTVSSLSGESDGESRCPHLSSQEYPFLATARITDNERMFRSGILHRREANGKTGGNFCRSNTKKVLLEFKSENILTYTLLQIGGYYITKHEREDIFCTDTINTSSLIYMTSRTPLWSLSFSCNEDNLPTNGPSCGTLLVESSISNDKCLQRDNTELFPHNGQFSEDCSDICLHLSTSMTELVKVNLEDSGECLVKPDFHPAKLADVSQSSGTRSTVSSELSSLGGLFHEGNLITLNGLVMGVHNNCLKSKGAYHSHEDIGDILKLPLLHGATNHICIHVWMDHRHVKVFGYLSKHAYPVGFGAGVMATFYRILDFGDQDKLMLTPVSLIVVNSTRPVIDKVSNLSSSLKTYSVASTGTVSSGLFSQMVHCTEHRKIQFCGRVIAVHILVFEKKYVKDGKVFTKLHSIESPLDIPLGAFVLDDGSSSCCCWTNAERASSLLRLHDKLPKAAFESTNWTLKWVERCRTAYKTTMYYLEKILNKHIKITVKNYGSILDSSGQDLHVTSSVESISIQDENLLKSVVLSACSGSSWIVTGNLMDLEVVRSLKNQHLTEIEIDDSMQNIWATKVSHLNPLSEARNIYQELVSS